MPAEEARKLRRDTRRRSINSWIDWLPESLLDSGLGFNLLSLCNVLLIASVLPW
jgi:hypothetical protein